MLRRLRSQTRALTIVTAALALIVFPSCAGQPQVGAQPLSPAPAPAVIAPPVDLIAALPAEAVESLSPVSLVASFSVPASNFLASLPEIAFHLWEVPEEKLPAQVDSNSPVFWDGGQMVIFNSAEHPFRATGASTTSLSNPAAITCIGCDRPGGRWLEAVWPDPSGGLLYGWYHLEPDDLDCHTAPVIGAAISRDGGRTWIDQGPVLETGYEIDCTYENGFFFGGNGDFHVIPDREHGYFYFFFSNYAGPIDEQGVGIARSAFADRGQPGTVTKYYQGGWTEPGVGGKVTPLFASSTGWKGPVVEAFWGPSVHWNDHLNAYVALLNHTDGIEWTQEGVYISFSTDLMRWSEPHKILDSGIWYPQVIGSGPNGTDTRAGKSARIYVGGLSSVLIEFE